jgi:uncharacterized coiled-coil DUF342 family protein
MSDRINQLVDTIREKTILLKDQIASEKAKNEELTKEIQTLKQDVSSRDEKMGELNNNITELNDGLKAVREQSIISADGNGVSEEQIDELVKEIEYCIEQLKK